jgi:uncharacterized protein YndB with AHSA1/START domain
MSDRRISATTTIQAAPEVVFALVSDPHQHPRIDGSGSVRGLVDGPHHVTKGDTFQVRMRLFGLPYTITNTVVEYQPARRIAWRHFGGHRWRYELEPTGSGTRVTETFDYSRYNTTWRTLVELTGFPARNRRGIEGTLVRLKEAAESDARTAADASRG